MFDTSGERLVPWNLPGERFAKGNLQRLHQQLRKGPAVVFGHAALGRDANEVGPNQGETSGDGKMPGQLAELQDIHDIYDIVSTSRDI